MDKVIKVLFLKTGQVVVSEIEEVVSELGEPDCKLINPKELIVNVDGTYKLNVWLGFTDQSEIMMHSDSILTIVDPKKSILDLYFK